MRKTVILLTILLSIALLSNVGFCWEWEEVFRANLELSSMVGDPSPDIPAFAFSKFENTDDDVDAVKLVIIQGGMPVHYHMIENPATNFTYTLTTIHFIDLFGCPAYMSVCGGNFENPTEYVAAKIVYPF